MSSFNPRNHGTLAFRRKERPCLSSSFLDVDPSRAPLVRVESSGTLSNRVSWEVRSGRFALDVNLNKPPPRATQRVFLRALPTCFPGARQLTEPGPSALPVSCAHRSVHGRRSSWRHNSTWAEAFHRRENLWHSRIG